MVLLGVILVLLAAAAGVVLVAGTAQLTDSVEIDVLGGTLAIPPLTLLITGMIVISVFWLGWALLRSGLRRSKRRRVEAKEAAAAREAERAEEQRRMQEEFAAREQALSEERRRREEAEALVTDQHQGGATVSGGTTRTTGSANDTAQLPSNTRPQGDRQA
jgi:type VI protein secretion system component VasK